MLQQKPTALPGKEVTLDQFLHRGPRFFPGQTKRIGGATEWFCRADPAAWRAGQADGRAQIHEGRIEVTGPLWWNERGGVIPDPFPSGSLIDRLRHVEEPGEQPNDVRFGNRNRLIESESEKGMSGVAAETREGQKLGRCMRALPGMILRNFPRGGVQVTGAAVIAKTLPGMKDFCF